jgi:nitrite reductase (NO-forming)
VSLNTLGALAGVAALVVAVLSYVRAGRPADRVRRGSTAARAPLGLVVVLVAVASTAGGLYVTEASRANRARPAADPIWWRIQHVHAAPQGVAGASEAPNKPATLPPLAKGKIVRRRIVVENKTIEIAPGVQVNAWTFNGTVPAPTIHIRVGQTLKVTFVNHGTTWHSFDSHGAELPYQHANQDIGVGQTHDFTYVATRPGAWLYHCFTFPGAQHIAAGMYGAIVVDDPRHPLPKADKVFLLTASEWYLDGDGQSAPANPDPKKAQSAFPDYATFNGYWQEYSYRPLHVNPGKRVRFYVVNAGPNFSVSFHVVGGVFDRVYPDGDESHFESNVQATDVAAGGAGIFDITFKKPGVYNFLNHVFANAVKGQLGEIVVGNPTSAR